VTGFRSRSVSWRLALLNGLVVGALVLSVFALVPTLVERRLREALAEESVGLCRMVASNVSAALMFEDLRTAQELLDSVGRQRDVLFAEVRREDGRILAQYRGPGSPETPPLPSPGYESAVPSPDGSRLEVETPVIVAGRPIGRVRVGMSLSNLRAEVRQIRKGLAGLSAVLFVVGIAATYAISAYVIRPLQGLAATAERVAAGDRTKRAAVAGRDEVGLLATAFNRMVDSLESAYRDLQLANSELEERVVRRTQQLQDEVTQRRAAVEAQAESERRYRSLFDENLSGSFVCDPDGKLIACNPAFAQIFGVPSPEEAMVRGVFSLFPEDFDRSAFLEQLRLHGRLRNQELTMQRADGRRVEVLGSFVGAFTGGRLREIQGYLFDTTERRSLEGQLRQAQKMDAVGRLAGGIAHDFNNLLTVILGFSDMILERVAPDDPIAGDLGEIHRAGERASALTRQLLAFSRQQVLEPRVLDLNEVVRGMSGGMLGRLIGEDIRIQTRLAADLGRVKADPGQIEQVILNLAVNARDAMPKGGTLTVETRNTELDDTFMQTTLTVSPGLYVLLAVTDTGVGMDAVTQSHLFEPFFTTKERGKGTGLGLATVYGIVKQSGGYIDVSSEPGRGSAFRIHLPRVEAEVTAGPGSLLRAEKSTGMETILLVEDEEAVRRLASRALEAAGYTVLEAGSGAEALDLLESAGGGISLLLTDVVMPGMGGPELAERVRVIRPELRFLFMSGYTDPGTVDQAALSRAGGFLQKPFTAAALTEKVRTELDRT